MQIQNKKNMNDSIIEFTARFFEKDERYDSESFDDLFFKEDDDFFEFDTIIQLKESYKKEPDSKIAHKYRFITDGKQTTTGKFKKETIGFSYQIVSGQFPQSGLEYLIENDRDNVFKDWFEDLEKIAFILKNRSKVKKDWKFERIVRFLTVWSFSSWKSNGYYEPEEWDCECNFEGILDLNSLKIKSIKEFENEKHEISIDEVLKDLDVDSNLCPKCKGNGLYYPEGYDQMTECSLCKGDGKILNKAGVLSA